MKLGIDTVLRSITRRLQTVESVEGTSLEARRQRPRTKKSPLVARALR